MIVNKHKYLIRKNCFKELLQGISKKGQFYLPRKTLIFMMCILLTYSSLSVDIVLFKYLSVTFYLWHAKQTNKYIEILQYIQSRFKDDPIASIQLMLMHFYIITIKNRLCICDVRTIQYASLRNYKD